MKATLLIALAGVLVVAMSSTAFGVLTYTPQPANHNFGIGVYNPNDPGTLNTLSINSDTIRPSDTFVVTFAAHMVAIFYNTESMHFNFIYDNSTIEVLGAAPVHAAGVWATNNYSGFSWPNPSSGIVSVSTLFQSAGAGTNFISMPTSAIVPFFQVAMHVKEGAPVSQAGFFGITQMTLVSHTFALTLFPGDFAYFNGDIHPHREVPGAIPEPATMTLVGGCMASLMGVLIRRRRTRVA